MTPDELVPLAWLAGRSLGLDEDELRGPIRRAMLLLASGGDPTREHGLALDGRAVTALAEELLTEERRGLFNGQIQQGNQTLGALQ